MISLIVGIVLLAAGAILLTRPRIGEAVVGFIARPALEQWERNGDDEPLQRYRRGMPLLRFLAAAFFFLLGAVLIMRGVT